MQILIKKNPINNGPVIKQRRGVEIKSSREIEIMRKSSKIVATVLSEIRDLVKPGMSTLDLDNYAEKRIRDHWMQSQVLKDIMASQVVFVQV